MKRKTISKKNITLGCHESLLLKKPYHERKGRPSPIKDACRLPTNRWGVPINNNGGGHFNKHQ